MPACIGMFMYVGVFANTYTLQVPMQPTGLSGRPLKPSFLLMARKRYACRETQAYSHGDGKKQLVGEKKNIHVAHDLTASLSVYREN